MDREIKNKNPYLVYLQPTSPLRKSKHIDQAFKSLKKNSHNLVSVSIGDKSLFKCLSVKGKKNHIIISKIL